MPTHRRRHLIAAVAALALAGLAGCGTADRAGTAAPATTAAAAASPTASAGPSFDPGMALALSIGKPYSATVLLTSTIDGKPGFTGSGRMNNGDLFTGRIEMRAAEPSADGRTVHFESVLTETSAYARDLAGPGPWRKLPRSADATLADYGAFARALATRGAEARKGPELLDGVPAYRFAGRFESAELETLDPRTARSLAAKGVAGFDCDLWIDRQGRTVRFEQRVELSGLRALNTAVFREFGEPETFTAPDGS
ncbi:hypothetical protein [Kitasatospora sp. NPDC002040]|uniref:hypothetical protein n=1 Tax=Kitasatospora sp. NPDC002040 TaxID=3154661 RepID=UPI0033208130